MTVCKRHVRDPDDPLHCKKCGAEMRAPRTKPRPVGRVATDPNAGVISLAAWIAEACRRFGRDPSKWRFKCPNCGNVASIGEWEQAGGQRERAKNECIGRLQGSGRGCDWTAFGLIRNPPYVSYKNRHHPVFGFDEPDA